MRKFIHALFASLVVITVTTSCEKIDNNRIPPVDTNLIFYTIGDWQLYGVSGAGEYRQFIKQDGIPAGYPYKISDATGFGGLLLVCDPIGEYLVYDLACPVESRPDIRVQADHNNPLAGMVKCPKCGSVYNLFARGAAAEGEALKARYGLQSYFISVGSTTPPYAVIHR